LVSVICTLIVLSALAITGIASTSGAAPLSGTQAPSASNTCTPTTTPMATADPLLDRLFSNQLGQTGPSWIGGDIAYSTTLPNKQEAFDFNDTVIGTATKEGKRAVINTPYEPLIHNSMLVGQNPLTGKTALTTDDAGTPTSPATLIPDTNTSGGFAYEWEVGAMVVVPAIGVVPAEQLVFVNEYKVITPGDLTFNGRSAMAIFSLPTGGLPTFQSTIGDSTVPTTMWGNALTQWHGYTYIYGTDESHQTDGAWMEVARVPSKHIVTMGDWRYWSGTSANGDPIWVRNEADAVPTTNSNLFTGVTGQRGGSGFESVQLAGSETAPTIDVAYACQPWGPWSSLTAVYTPPETATYGPDEIAYTPTFHPELDHSGETVISYSINNTAGLVALRANIHEYQPRFLLLSTSS
jgi:hypothetical protein